MSQSRLGENWSDSFLQGKQWQRNEDWKLQQTKDQVQRPKNMPYVFKDIQEVLEQKKKNTDRT